MNSLKKRDRLPDNDRKLSLRLEAAADALKEEGLLRPEDVTEILQERARQLAALSKSESKSQFFLDVVEFYLADDRYCIESKYVQEVIRLKDVTPIPCTPFFHVGLMTVRGQALSMIDIKRFLNLPEKGLTNLSKAIVVEYGDIRLGILAETIVGVRSIDPAEIQAPLPTLGAVGGYLRGLTAGNTLVLDVVKILSDKRMEVQEEVVT